MPTLRSTVRKYSLWIVSTLLGAGIFALMHLSPSAAPVTFRGVPIPFLQEGSSTKGALTLIGKRSGFDVYEVKYTNGEISETLLPDRVYLVHVPEGSDIVEASLDAVFSAVGSNGRNINFFGYKYTDADASEERSQLSAFLFKDRFPGQFFASKKSRDEDAGHGNMLSAFEVEKGVSFRKTDGTSGSVKLDGDGSLFVFVVNDPNGARFFVRRSGVCGNGVLEPTEYCDDGNSVTSDACTNTCENGIPIPFESPDTSTSGKLRVTVRTTSVTGNAVHGQAGITLLRAEASAAEDVRFKKLRVRADAGSLDNAANYTLWRDTDGDAVVDTILPSTVTTAAGVLTFDAIGGANGLLLARNTTTVIDVVADVAASPASPRLQLGLALQAADVVGGSRVAPALPLSGTRINGACSQSACEMVVVTNPSTVWTLVSQPVCGNTVIEGDEQCDEGQHNGTVCTPTNGGTCTYCSALCRTVTLHGAASCGNGAITGSEACDDSNTTAGDGCSATCSIESGFTCTGAPSVCTPQGGGSVCGNGAITGSEACDDSNTTAGDGCSASCAVESNFRCTGTPSTCESYADYVFNLADTNNNSAISDTEALLLTLDVADAADQPYASVSQFDIDNDGDVDDTDITTILSVLDSLTS